MLSIGAFWWLSEREPAVKDMKVVSEKNDKFFYFSIPEKMETGKEYEISLAVKSKENKIANFKAEFIYDPLMLEIKEAKLNREIFDKGGAQIDGQVGKVRAEGSSLKPMAGEEIKLVNLKIKVLKKGGSMIYQGERPTVGVENNGQRVVDEAFEMPNFKINFL